MRQIFLVILCFVPIFIFSQDIQTQKLLDKVSKLYESYTSMELNFTMTITAADNVQEVSEAKIIQKGNSFIFKGKDQSIYCNEQSVWYHLAQRNEVQINDYEYDPEDYTVITPKDLLRQYRSGKYEYLLINETPKEAIIEFKPLERDGDYSKFKMRLDKSSNKVMEVEAFSKDGSKVLIKLKTQKINQDYPASTFVFDPSKFIGIHVEDLRLN